MTFDVVYAEHRARVFALCLHLLRDRSEAEDALQECFLDVSRGLKGFRGEAQLSTWIYRIAIRAAFRTGARRPAPSAPLDDAHAAGGPAPDEIAVARQELGRLKRALEQLGAEQRVVLSLFAVEGLGHQEIAAVLGVPVGTVWSRLHGARKRLAELM